jgi:hypothetical protein
MHFDLLRTPKSTVNRGFTLAFVSNLHKIAINQSINQSINHRQIYCRLLGYQIER